MRTRVVLGFAAALAVAGVVTWLLIQPGTRALAGDETWGPQDGPHVVTEVVRVPKGVTLTIQPGTIVQFAWRTGLIVEGRLVCVGNERSKIVLTRPADSNRSWGGIAFRDTTEDNRLHHVAVRHSGTGEACLDVLRARLSIEHAAFKKITHTVIRAQASSLRVRHSVFFPVGKNEVIFGSGIPEGGSVLIEDNVFHPNRGRRDIIDYSDCRRPGPIPRFVGNVFMGGEDDGLDLDRCDAEVESNVFFGFHSSGDWEANAISLGAFSKVTVSNNLCFDNDHGIVSYEQAFLTATRNTLYGNRIAGINLEEDGSPGGASIDRCILWQNGVSIRARERATELNVTHSVLPEAADWPGAGNSAEDPRFVSVAERDFNLAADSPAAGKGADLPDARVPQR